MDKRATARTLSERAGQTHTGFARGQWPQAPYSTILFRYRSMRAAAPKFCLNEADRRSELKLSVSDLMTEGSNRQAVFDSFCGFKKNEEERMNSTSKKELTVILTIVENHLGIIGFLFLIFSTVKDSLVENKTSFVIFFTQVVKIHVNNLIYKLVQ